MGGKEARGGCGMKGGGRSHGTGRTGQHYYLRHWVAEDGLGAHRREAHGDDAAGNVREVQVQPRLQPAMGLGHIPSESVSGAVRG